MEGEADRREDEDASEGQSDNLDDYRDEVKERYPGSGGVRQRKAQKDSGELSEHNGTVSDAKLEDNVPEADRKLEQGRPQSDAEGRPVLDAELRSDAADDHAERTGEHSESSPELESQSDLERLRDDVKEKYPDKDETGHGDEQSNSGEYPAVEGAVERDQGSNPDGTREEENSGKANREQAGSPEGNESELPVDTGRHSNGAEVSRGTERTEVESIAEHEGRQREVEQFKEEIKEKYPIGDVDATSNSEVKISEIEDKNVDGQRDSSIRSNEPYENEVKLEKDDPATRDEKRSEPYQIRQDVGEGEHGKLRESQLDNVGKQFEQSPLGQNILNAIDQKIANTGEISQLGNALAVESTAQGSIGIQHDDKRDNHPVSGRGTENKVSADSDDDLKSKGDSLPLTANPAETVAGSNGKSSMKEETESARVASDERNLQNQLDSADQRQVVLSLTPHFYSSSDVQFCLSKASLEIQTGTKLEAGKLVEIKGSVDGIYEFHEYRFLSESKHIKIYVPKEYAKEMRAGGKRQVTIVSIEDKKISNSVSEILGHFKHGQNWRYIANRTELSSKTTPNDLKWLTDPRVPHHRIPLEDSLRNNQGVSNEEWKRYLGKLIERELSQARAKENGNPKHVSQTRSEIANRNKTEVPTTTAPTIKREHGRQEVAPLHETNGRNRAMDASVPAGQTRFAGKIEQNGEAQVTRSHNEIRNPGSWEWVAGFFDGEGSIILNVRKYSIGIEVTFAQKYSPLLDSVREFLRDKGVKSAAIYKSGNADRLSIHSTEDVANILREMLPHLRLKENQARATLDYLEDRINGKDLVQIFNQEVEAGRRSGNLRALPDQPLRRTESIRRLRKAQMKNAQRALHRPLDRLDEMAEL